MALRQARYMNESVVEPFEELLRSHSETAAACPLLWMSDADAAIAERVAACMRQCDKRCPSGLLWQASWIDSSRTGTLLRQKSYFAIFVSICKFEWVLTSVATVNARLFAFAWHRCLRVQT